MGRGLGFENGTNETQIGHIQYVSHLKALLLILDNNMANNDFKACLIRFGHLYRLFGSPDGDNP